MNIPADAPVQEDLAFAPPRPMPRRVATPPPRPRSAPLLWLAAQAPDPEVLAPARQSAWLRRATQFTPRVCLEPPDALLLELAGSRRLFGGLAPLLARLRESFPAPWRLAAAPTPLAALALARGGRSVCIAGPARLRSRLAPLPLSVLRWPDDLLERLQGMGVGCLGELLRLPREGLARRIGPRRVRELDRLLGAAGDPRRPQAPAEGFAERVDLDVETFDSGLVLAALAPSLARLEEFLRARQKGITALRVRLSHRSGPATACVVRCVVPEYHAQRLSALLAARLQSLLLAQPARAASVQAGRLCGLDVQACGLWQAGEQGGQAGHRAPELLQTLHARLGGEAVYGLACVAGHRPERQWRRTLPGLAPRRATLLAPQVPAARPLGLLDPPLPLVEQRDGQGRVRGLLHRGARLELASGPERIESGWWDGAGIARDYYVARSGEGALLWVFREREGARHWFLHGYFS